MSVSPVSRPSRKSPISLIAKVLNETAVAPEVVKPDVPHAISELVMRLLEKAPVERIGGAAMLGQALAVRVNARGSWFT